MRAATWTATAAAASPPPPDRSAQATPNLAPPALNGGPTETEALQAGSQAIGLGVAATCEQLAGPDGTLDTDQRGRARNSAARNACDSGAYDTGGDTKS